MSTFISRAPEARAGMPPVPAEAWAATRSPWAPILAAYALYVFLTFLNDVTGANLQFLGALPFLAVLAASAAPHLFPVPLSGLTIALLLAVLGPVVAWLTGAAEAPARAYAIKYFALLFVVWAAEVLRLPPLYRARERRIVFGLLLAVLLLGWWWGDPSEISAERVEGIFVNPNSFALAAMSLLFLADLERDARGRIVALYALVLGLILLSGTAGALLGYLAGLGATLLRFKTGRLVCAAAAVAAAVLLLLPDLLSHSRVESLGETRMIGPIWSKFILTRDYGEDLLAGDDLNFWEVGQQRGGVELTSSLWRLWQWRETIRAYHKSGWGAKGLGHGLGSSIHLLDNLPHNEYLRLLLETGLLGLAANLAVWLILFRRIRPADRSMAVMMGVFSFTENNLDNFLVMGLFALFMVSAGHGAAPPPRPAPPEPAPR